MEQKVELWPAEECCCGAGAEDETSDLCPLVSTICWAAPGSAAAAHSWLVDMSSWGARAGLRPVDTPLLPSLPRLLPVTSSPPLFHLHSGHTIISPPPTQEHSGSDTLSVDTSDDINSSSCSTTPPTTWWSVAASVLLDN